jgi:hypothetical protein
LTAAYAYLAHFALNTPSFSKEVADDELWLPASKQSVVDTLINALQRPGVRLARRRARRRQDLRPARASPPHPGRWLPAHVLPQRHAPPQRLLPPTLPRHIHHRLEISALTPDDTIEYLRMRLARAGCTREVFASDATVLLHEATAGAMRDLDRLAAAALRESARKNRKLVESDIVNQVVEADTRERDR